MKRSHSNYIKTVLHGFISLIALLAIVHNRSMAQSNIEKLGILINENSFKMPDGVGDSIDVEYSFLYARCFCSISQASRGKKDRMNTISTFSFNLSKLQNGRILVSKPKDSDFKEIKQDIWTIEIGMLDVMIQNTNWQSRQTRTNHFYFNVKGVLVRDQIIEFFKKAADDCGGDISEVSILDN